MFGSAFSSCTFFWAQKLPLSRCFFFETFHPAPLRAIFPGFSLSCAGKVLKYYDWGSDSKKKWKEDWQNMGKFPSFHRTDLLARKIAILALVPLMESHQWVFGFGNSYSTFEYKIIRTLENWYLLKCKIRQIFVLASKHSLPLMPYLWELDNILKSFVY